jgi:glycosyltransferase involved in cell wall biosynthesis
MTPFFTIIITTYNRANLLKQTLKSLANQTFLDFELIIIDNYSNDETIKVINQFRSFNLKLFQLKNNGIIAVSRNFAINKSTGEWIAFLDSDDLWSANKLQKCFDLINNKINYISLIYHGMDIIKNNRSFGRLRTRELLNPAFNNLLVKGNTIAFSSVVVKKDLLVKVNGFNCSENMINTSDYNTWLKIAHCGYEITYLPESLGSYRIHEGNLSNHDFFPQVMEAVKEFLPLVSVKDQNNIRNMQIYAQSMIYFSQKRYSDSRNILKTIRFKESFVFWFKSKIRLIGLFFIIRNIQ